ncbi:hypothetical protein [Nonomuraea sp. SYSU D8015]|uniref:hypothetical protein n=1 Tax=Nonomuraea sp. SYSU D8015 TaxID=2593644 RepID=UPI0016604257|nr:hypothetical protein [Nonomuraea sp. SYSU D8015]
MPTRRGIMASVLLAAGLLTVPGVLASPASAGPAGPAAMMALTLDGGSCERLARRFLCEVSYSGAVAPVTIRWFVNGNHVPAYDNRSFVGIGCQPGSSYDIRAVISDATGASVEFRSGGICRSGNP